MPLSQHIWVLQPELKYRFSGNTSLSSFEGRFLMKKCLCRAYTLRGVVDGWDLLLGLLADAVKAPIYILDRQKDAI